VDEVLPFPKRMDALKVVLWQHPELPAGRRRKLFDIAAAGARPQPVLTWEHMMECRDTDCLTCRDGEIAA